MDIQNLDIPTQDEVSEIFKLVQEWNKARSEKNWKLADSLREQVRLWDSLLCQDGYYGPMWEHNLNRQRRAYKRMNKYNINIYPWSI